MIIIVIIVIIIIVTIINITIITIIIISAHACAPETSISYTKMCAPKNVVFFLYTLKSLYFCFHKNNVIFIFEVNKTKLIKPQRFFTNLRVIL